MTRKQLAETIMSEILGIQFAKNRDKENTYNLLLKGTIDQLKSFRRIIKAKG